MYVNDNDLAVVKKSYTMFDTQTERIRNDLRAKGIDYNPYPECLAQMKGNFRVHFGCIIKGYVYLK